MRVSVSRERLSNGLQHALKAVSANHPISILSGVKLLVRRNGGLTVTTSNLSMSIQFMIPPDDETLSIREEGSIVINARYFYEIIRKLPSGIVYLELKEPLLLIITSGKSLFRLAGFDAEQFPVIPEPNDNNITFRLQNKTLKTAIRQVTFAVATAENRPVLTGVSCQLDGDSLKMTATDGIRLASRAAFVHSSNSKYTDIVIPGKNILELSKILTDDEEMSDVTIDGNQIHFSAKNMLIHSALIEGTYPSINKIIPTSHLTEITLDTSGFLQALERVCLLANGSIIRMKTGANNTVELTSKTDDIGDVVEEVTIEDADGEEVAISFNGMYMIDILRHIDCDKVTVKLSGKWGPIVLQPFDASDSATYIITPVRTHN